MNMTKLQKLLYIVYAVYLVVEGNAPFEDEQPRAWPFGPVFPKVRKAFLDCDLNSGTYGSDIDEATKQKMNHFIAPVLDYYGTWTSTQLSDWSHEEGAPWDRVVNEDGLAWNTIIPDDYIKEYFSTIISIDE